MQKWVTWVLVGVLLIVVGAVLGLFLRAKRVIDYPQMHKFDGDDPPVTVGDSSFDATSPNDWRTATTSLLIPNGATTAKGTLVNCEDWPGLGLVEFYDGAKAWDASPLPNQGLNMTIIHAGRPITVTTNADHTNLSITDPGNGWGPSSFYFNTSKNKYSDHIAVVRYIDPMTGRETTTPSKGGNTLAHVDFCYK